MNIRSILTLPLWATAFASGVQTASADAPVRIELSVTEEDGLVANNQKVVFAANVRNESESLIQGMLTWTVHTVAFVAPTRVPEQIRIEANEGREYSIELSLPVPGFADVECAFKDAKSDESIVKRRRIGRQPEQIRAPLTQPLDFDEFWKNSLVALNSIPPQFEVVARSESSTDSIEVYEITMRSLGDARVRGWLEVPRSKGPHPAVLLVPGYGQDMRPIGKWDDMIVFSFNPRGHGNSQEDVPGKPVDYWIRGLDDKKTYFYRGAYLDCIRAVDFLASRADVDQERIAVWGGSQGGGFAFATASLDRRIDLCVADIPFLCDWVNYFKLTHWPEMDGWIAANEARTWGTTLTTLSYFDTMNMAQRIRCPTLMGVGLQDQICPPTTNFAVFNRITAVKSFRIYPNKGHGLDEKHDEHVWRSIRESFELATM